MILLFAMSCSLQPACEGLDQFTDRWWQIYVSSNPIDNCYLFSDDGHFVIRSNGYNAPIGRWETSGTDECKYAISVVYDGGDKDSLTLTGFDKDCWSLEYDNKEYSACECLEL